MKNDAYLKDNHLTAKYYYEGYEGCPRATVCLLIESPRGVIARGVAVCSIKDNFVKETGRAKALGMAVMALKKGTSKPMTIVSNLFAFHSEYQPKLTPKEMSMMTSTQKED